MKICKYCESKNADTAKACSVCGANAFKNLCNSCGTVFESPFCPVCGTKAGSQGKVCPNCGERYFTPACPKCGHNDAVTRVHKQEAEKTQRIIVQHVMTPQEEPKKRVPIVKILLWVFFLPIMLFITVWLSQSLSIKEKLAITVVIPALILLCYPLYEKHETIDTTPRSVVQYSFESATISVPSESVQATVLRTTIPAKDTSVPVKETAAPVRETKAPVKETAAPAKTTDIPAKQARNGFKEGLSKHTVASYSFSVPTCFGSSNTSTTEKDFLFFTPDDEVILLLSFSNNDITTKDFDVRIKQGFLNMFQNAELTEVKEAKVAGLPGRVLNATGYYSNMHMNARAAIALDESQQGVLSIILIQGDTARYDYYSDFNYIVRSTTKAQQKTTAKPSPSSAQKESSDTVSKDLKKVLDEYEAFVDSYCAFMKKDSASNDVSSMTMDYLTMLSKLAEWEYTLDDIDEDALSGADLLYYDAVMLRCAYKLLQAPVS